MKYYFTHLSAIVYSLRQKSRVNRSNLPRPTRTPARVKKKEKEEKKLSTVPSSFFRNQFSGKISTLEIRPSPPSLQLAESLKAGSFASPQFAGLIWRKKIVLSPLLSVSGNRDEGASASSFFGRRGSCNRRNIRKGQRSGWAPPEEIIDSDDKFGPSSTHAPDIV